MERERRRESRLGSLEVYYWRGPAIMRGVGEQRMEKMQDRMRSRGWMR